MLRVIPCFIILIFLCACASPTPAPTPTFTSILTDTPASTDNPTEAPTPTFTATWTPEATATPGIEAQAAVTPKSFENFSYDTGFIPVTYEQDIDFCSDVRNGVDAKLSSDDSVNPAILFGSTAENVWLTGVIGVSLFPRFAISEQLEHGGTGHFVLWEIIVKDNVSGHNKRECLKLAFDTTYPNDSYEMPIYKTILNHIATAEAGFVNININTTFDSPIPEQVNPAIWDETDKAGQRNPIRQKLMQGIIDETTGTIPMWIRDITGAL
jgi:hypothetical protein